MRRTSKVRRTCLIGHSCVGDLQGFIQDFKSFRQLLLIDDQWRIHQDHIPMDKRLEAVIQQVLA